MCNSSYMNLEYIGLFLEKESKENLQNVIPLKFESMILDHITLYHSKSKDIKVYDRLMEYLEEDNIYHFFTITHIGFSDKCMAFKVDINLPCSNSIPHITIMILGSGKPIDSNYITNWIELDYPITEWGILKCKYYD